jgi:hypothetical protein
MSASMHSLSFDSYSPSIATILYQTVCTQLDFLILSHAQYV